MLVLSVALNFTQAYRSQQAAARLRLQVAQTATVIRDGVEREVPVREVVVGDVVSLTAGDLVPADGRLLSTPRTCSSTRPRSPASRCPARSTRPPEALAAAGSARR